jgi:hypothetical protein
MASGANENNNENYNEGMRDEHIEERRERHPASAPTGPTFAEPEQCLGDLAPELALALPRAANQMVRCRRISGNHYRCNWWGPQDTAAYDNPSMGGLLVTTHRVIRSQMLRVSKSATGLVIDPDPCQ